MTSCIETQTRGLALIVLLCLLFTAVNTFGQTPPITVQTDLAYPGPTDTVEATLLWGNVDDQVENRDRIAFTLFYGEKLLSTTVDQAASWFGSDGYAVVTLADNPAEKKVSVILERTTPKSGYGEIGKLILIGGNVGVVDDLDSRSKVGATLRTQPPPCAWPVPARESLNIRMPDNGSSVGLWGSGGRKIMELEGKPGALLRTNVGHLPNGVYFLVGEGGTQKISIQH